MAIERRISRADRLVDELGEVAQHPLAVGLEAGEELERVSGLEHRHPAAVERAAAELARVLQKLGLERAVDDLGHPQAGVQQLLVEWEAGMALHAGRGGVDESVGVGEALRACPA